MKRRRLIANEALGMIAFTSVALAFQLTVQRRQIDTPWTQCPPRKRSSFRPLRAVSPFHSSSCLDPQLLRLPFGNTGRENDNGLVMMGRTSRQQAIRAEQKRRAKNAPVVLSAKDRRRANRERRAYYREKFASSSRRLIKLQQEDGDSFYIGFVGGNRVGRAAALNAVEAFLKRATELKVAKYYKDDANIKLVDAGNLRLSEMAGKDEHKLGLLRRCDLLVHVVRCFDLYPPKPYAPKETISIAEAVRTAKRAVRGEKDSEKEEEIEESKDEDVDWPLSPTPLEDVKSVTADMADADLHFIEERQKSNHTRWFWRDKRRAYNERDALELVTPVLEDTYAAGGELRPVGIDFRNSCLRDEPSVNGTVIYRSRLRAAIQEIGFLTPKPVVYAANLPPETSPLGDLEDVNDVNDDANNGVESPAAIANVARAHADKVTGLNRDYRVPAVASCLTTREGQESLGATVFKSIPRSVLNRDPKIKKAAKSAASKARRKQSIPQDLGTRRPPVVRSQAQVGKAPVSV